MTGYRLMIVYRKTETKDLLCRVGEPSMKAIASGYTQVRISDLMTGMAKCFVLVFVYNGTRHAWRYIRQVPSVVPLRK